ncbi:MAG: hypothetical protein SW127_11150, partial [Actinomycetota bacterium]|nr:hypothetical protein [Actinomycetota bacterium]
SGHGEASLHHDAIDQPGPDTRHAPSRDSNGAARDHNPHISERNRPTVTARPTHITTSISLKPIYDTPPTRMFPQVSAGTGSLLTPATTGVPRNPKPRKPDINRVKMYATPQFSRTKHTDQLTETVTPYLQPRR